MLKVIKKIIAPECFKYGVQCSSCKASFQNLDEHEEHIRNKNLEGNHKNYKIKITKK